MTTEELKDLFKDNLNHGDEDTLHTQALENGFSAMGQSQFHHLLLINPGEKEETFTREVALQPAKPLPGKVVGPDGQPFAEAIAYRSRARGRLSALA